jgi:hypothetical protein
MNHFDLRANLIERRSIEVDPDLAKHYLTFNNYIVQRKLRRGHVDELAEKMKDGRFREGEISFGVYNDDSFMMNGQHQCIAIIQSGETIPCRVEKYRCKSEMDLSDLFAEYDTFLPRSLQDIVKARVNGLHLKWPNYIASLVVSAATIEYTMKQTKTPYALKGRIVPSSTGKEASGKKPLSKNRRVALLDEYLKEGDFVNEVFTNVDGNMKMSSFHCRHIGRAPVVYVMFLTMRKNEKDALEFWVSVRDGEILTKDMPEMKLREFLKSVNSITRPYSYRVVKSHEYICRCIMAWNAFRTKTKTNLAYSPSKDIPMVK